MPKLFDKKISYTDDYYSLLIDEPEYLNKKRYVESLWEMFHPYADKSFRFEIAHQFFPRFWEMYLGCFFLKKGFELLSRDSDTGPDLKLNHHNKTIWIEAISPTVGQGSDKVPELKPGVVMNVPKKQIILRYSSSIAEKYKKLENYKSKKIVKDDDIFIIAINGFKVEKSHMSWTIPLIVKSVFPVGNEQVTIDLNTGEIIDEKYKFRSDIEKKSGSIVSTNIFMNPKHSGISGIIYSRAELWNLPWKMGADFVYISNPKAKNVFERTWLPDSRHFWVDENDFLRWDPPEKPNKFT